MNLLGRRPPGHRRGKAAPDAVEDPDDLRGAAIGGQVDRAPRIPLLTEHAVGHGEPAVVDAFDGPTGFACADAEMADRLARVKNHTRSGFQCTPPAMFAAGDVAAARMDDEHLSVMSCQHGRPMGRYAGCNVINDLFDQPLLALRIPWYVTVLDLGSAGAVYTEGWERKVVSQGAPAKTTKQSINTRRIYPPLNGSRADLLAAAAPRVQPRP